jgi:hypothetical protein
VPTFVGEAPSDGLEDELPTTVGDDRPTLGDLLDGDNQG